MVVYKRKLLTIITESILEQALKRDFEKMGIRGFTIVDARGKGRRGERLGNWDSSTNIRIEIVCTEEVGAMVAKHLYDNYYHHSGMISYLSDVDVLRPDKFTMEKSSS